MRGLVVVLVVALVAAVAASAKRVDAPRGLSTTDQTAGMPKAAIDLTAIPLGTGKGGTTARVGYLDRCGGVPSGGPPVKIPPWVGSSTWNATTKVAVEGDVSHTPSFKAVHSGSREVLTGNGLPAVSGTFPVASSDPADAYNPDPGSITSHTISLSLPYNPTVASHPSCESGTVGLENGIPLLDGFDAGGNDASAVEVQDACHGHPNDVVGYHYHSLSPCVLTTSALTHATQVGWALDGFGIYVEYDAQGQLLTNSALDVCHGRTSVIPWHGKMTRIYHYDMTFEFPYSVGCYRGTPISFQGMMIPNAGSTGQQSGGGGGGQQQGSSGSGGSGQQAAAQQCQAQGLTPGTPQFGQCMSGKGYPPD
ncbi:MAG: YHYH protein [Actinobacteria bacterium]|nr:YHYH protein [Actinomycetota bacterium]